MSAMPDLGDVYNAVVDRYSGDIDRDLSEAGLPPDLALAVGRVAAVWAVSGPAPPVMSAALAFYVGLMVGAEWERARDA